MPSLNLSRVTVAIDGEPLLHDVTLTIAPGRRLGVVGPNGAGKTTLLRVLAGELAPHEGTVTRTPAGLTVGLLPQEVDTRPGESLLAYLARRTGVARAEAEMDALAADMETGVWGVMGDRRTTGPPIRDWDVSVVEAYTAALERFLALGGADLATRAATVCASLGLPGRLGEEADRLSGGQGARAALAAILLSRFDVLLLDEPTNDLDLAGLDSLEEFVSTTDAGIVAVSHDRAFLQRACTTMAEVQAGTGRVAEYAGGWDEFVQARDRAKARREAEYDRYRSERERLTDLLRTQKQWAEAGQRRARLKPEPDKHIRRGKMQGAENLAAKGGAIEKRLARLDRDRVDKPWEGWRLQMQLQPATRSGDVVATLDRAVVMRGTFRLGPLDLDLRRRDRLAVLGPNGSGKSTLLGAILGMLPLTSGTRKVGPGVVPGTLGQRRDDFPPDQPLLASFRGATGLTVEEARSLLAKFGLGAAHVLRAAASLSPGERSRAALAALMARGVNCLVLDEPTNHLDLPAIEELEEALAGYEGTLVVVTHDRAFLDALSPTATLDLF